ncbi:MAG: hypothetical protein H0V41_03020 [Pseudonocardiales bacterium]|nr:hypothetical protein [Pseudonocardiales bacterium]
MGSEVVGGRGEQRHGSQGQAGGGEGMRCRRTAGWGGQGEVDAADGGPVARCTRWR